MTEYLLRVSDPNLAKAVEDCLDKGSTLPIVARMLGRLVYHDSSVTANGEFAPETYAIIPVGTTNALTNIIIIPKIVEKRVKGYFESSGDAIYEDNVVGYELTPSANDPDAYHLQIST